VGPQRPERLQIKKCNSALELQELFNKKLYRDKLKVSLKGSSQKNASRRVLSSKVSQKTRIVTEEEYDLYSNNNNISIKIQQPDKKDSFSGFNK